MPEYTIRELIVKNEELIATLNLFKNHLQETREVTRMQKNRLRSDVSLISRKVAQLQAACASLRLGKV